MPDARLIARVAKAGGTSQPQDLCRFAHNEIRPNMMTDRTSVRAIKYLRSVRGGSRGSLVQCSDGHVYVVKSPGNPQGTRTLVNEFVATAILQALNIDTPRTGVIHVSQDFLDQYSDFDPAPKHDRHDLVGCHFGSRVPVAVENPIYDFWPDVLVPRLSNQASFAGALVVDQWLGNTDHPQSIFVRREHLTPAGTGMTALHIDRGMTCGGITWTLYDSPLHGLNNARPAFYDHVATWADLRPWTRAVESFSEVLIRRIGSAVPREWIENDHDYDRLLDQVAQRRWRATYRMEDLIRSQSNPFHQMQHSCAVAANWC